jgi:hypothetical protein
MYLQIKKGQRLLVIAKGLWSLNIRAETVVWLGPDGYENRLAGNDYICPGANTGCLVAKIGRDGTPFPVGNNHDFVSSAEGLLFMAMNDNPDHNNQGGEIDAQMILFDL